VASAVIYVAPHLLASPHDYVKDLLFFVNFADLRAFYERGGRAAHVSRQQSESDRGFGSESNFELRHNSSSTSKNLMRVDSHFFMNSLWFFYKFLITFRLELARKHRSNDAERGHYNRNHSTNDRRFIRD
jgi:hypothetical protein